MAKFKFNKSRAAHAKASTPCKWFARCENAAVTTQSHPVLGDVPICQRCLDWYKRMGGKR
jgi:hypothetical protein